MTENDYQKPPPFWAHRVVRAMTKTCATHDIGMDGFCLVSMIVHQWDTIRYVRRVSYRIGTLMGLLGIESKQRFYRIEALAIHHGWLQKRTNGTRKPVHYTVHIPLHAMELGDLPTEDGEIQEENRTNNGTNTGTNNGTNTDTLTGEIPLLKPSPNRRDTDTQTGTPSTLYPLPGPLPKEEREIDPSWINEKQPDSKKTTGAKLSPLEWKPRILSAGGKIFGRDGEAAWQGPIDRYGIDAILATMDTMPPIEASDPIKVRNKIWLTQKREREARQVKAANDAGRSKTDEERSIVEAAKARNQQAYEWMARIVAYIEAPDAPGSEELRQRILCHHSGPAQIQAVSEGKVNALAVDSILRKIPELRPIAEGKPLPTDKAIA